MFSQDHPNPYGPSMVKLVPDAQTNTNKIVARIMRTGVRPEKRGDTAYADVSQYEDLHGSLRQVAAGRAAARRILKAREKAKASKEEKPGTVVPPKGDGGLVPPTPASSDTNSPTPSKPM